MSGTQHLRSFIEERLTRCGVVEKTISEYEEQVVQSKRELEQLRQDITHLNTLRPSIQLYRTDLQPVCEELLPLQQLNPRQELMSSQEDEVLQHHSPQVKEEQLDLTFGESESTSSDSRLISSYATSTVAVQRSTRAKEEHIDLGMVPDSEPSNDWTNGFVESDSQMIPSYITVTAQQSPEVKEEQDDVCIIPDSPETSFYDSGTHGFVTSESTSDSHPSYATETAVASHDAVGPSDGPADATSGQRDVADMLMEQKVCRFCRKQFRSYSDLVKHVDESHAGQKAFQCPVCDKEFARRDKFSVHYRIHTGEKRHSCPVCGKSFTQRSNCIIHMRTHTGVKPHSCPVCRKLFAHSSNLAIHMRTHTGVKVCRKSFSQSNNVQLHTSLHTGVRGHTCHVCGKVFNQKSNLKVHMRIHTGGDASEVEEVGGQY